jgi:glycosyltransferase involved in cell wall biosynthesis
LSFFSLHVNTEPTWRGGEQQTFSLLEGLRERGYPAALIASPGSPLFRRARDAGFETYGVPIRSEADLLAVIRVARVLRRLRPRLIHLHTSHAHTIGVCAAKLAGLGAVRVVSRRVSFSIYRHSFFGLNWVKYCYGVDRYLAVSAAVRDVLVRDGVDPRRVRVVHSGVDPARFAGHGAGERERLLEEWQLPRGVPLVGSAGALVPYKGFGTFIEAAAEVVRRRPCSFLIVGEGEERPELAARIRRLGLERSFRLLGFRDDIGAVLRALDVFVFPSLEEGLGSAVLEALLLGKPTIASRVGGIPEVIQDGENGLLVEPADPRALGEAIEEVLAAPELGSRLGAGGVRTVRERFHVDGMVEATLESYHELVGGAVPRSLRPEPEAAEVVGASRERG